MKENKNIAIVGFTINILIFIGLLGVLGIYFYGEIMSIEELKKENLEYQQTYNNLKTKGLDYDSFKNIKGVTISTYKKKILDKINEDFYNKNFINKDTKKFITYNSFLTNLDSEIKGDLKESYDKKHNKINSVMPVYADSADQYDKGGVLTDFMFINTIENLLHKYNLTTNSNIGIQKISKVDQYSDSKGNSDLGADIYVISLKLRLEGKKSKIIKFMEDVYKMGNVYKINNNGEYELLINNDNNFIELEELEMSDYIDSSPSVDINNKKKDLAQLIKTTSQGNEDFGVDVKLNFYVQGLANYKIKESINDVIGKINYKNLTKNKKDNLDKIKRINYYEIISRLQKIKTKNKSDKLVLRQLSDIENYLKSIKKDIILIEKNTRLGKDLLKSFQQVEQYKSIFALISNKLDKFDKK